MVGFMKCRLPACVSGKVMVCFEKLKSEDDFQIDQFFFFSKLQKDSTAGKKFLLPASYF